MSKELKKKKSEIQNSTPKKEMIKFLYKTKNKAKENNISYDMRVVNYTANTPTIYTYGIR